MMRDRDLRDALVLLGDDVDRGCAAAACMRSRPRREMSVLRNERSPGGHTPSRWPSTATTVGFVHGHPPRDQVAERLGAYSGIPCKTHWSFRSCEAPRLRKPHREREVVQRDHRLHAVPAAGADEVRIVRQRVRVEFPRLRLDASPLHRESVRVVVHRTELFEILAIAMELIDGDHRVASPSDRFRMVGYPPRPVVVNATLPLMRSGRASEEESFREPPTCHPRAAGASRTRRRNPSAGSSTITLTPFLRLHARTANACSAIGERTSRRPPGSEPRVCTPRPRRALPGSVHRLLCAAQVEDGGLRHLGPASFARG